MMNPVELSRTPEDLARYRGEPYVLGADVSSAPGMVGRCGWTWYTGSAAWMYRIWIEEVLGFQLRGDMLTLKPVLPPDWPGFEMTYRYRSTRYEIVVTVNPNTAMELELDGQLLHDGTIRLVDDGVAHHVAVRLQRKSSPKERQPMAAYPAVIPAAS
jgi:cellobiose phosphorylase